MHYPWWYISGLTAPMLIAIVSVVHVLVAHYAVGGGLFLAVETTYAHRTGDRDYLAYLKRHARFFVLLTVVFGAITGVGIWWTIGLASPLATSVLIRTFVFGWATEWVFFVLEIASAFVFYYYWDRLPRRTHTIVVWIYAAAAWLSLVIITAVTGFMLHPGHWLEDQNFWTAVLNPQFLPQTLARTGGALLLSSLYVFLHASIMIKDPRLSALIEGRSTRPALLGAMLIMLGGLAWYIYLPDSARDALYSASVLNVLMAVIFAATGVVFCLLYFGPYRNPGWIRSPGFAASLLLFGLAAFSTGEFIREAVRKPYVVYNVVLGNQVMATPDEVTPLQEHGFLEGGLWTKAYVADQYPNAMTDGHVDPKKLAKLPRIQKARLGGVIFQYHCNDCHALEVGYSAVGPLIQGWIADDIRAAVKHMHRKRFTMPPWSGTDAEVDLVTEYLETIRPMKPAHMRPAEPQQTPQQAIESEDD